MRGLQGPGRSLVRFTAIEGGDPQDVHIRARGVGRRDLIKVAVVLLLGSCLCGAVALAWAVGSQKMAVAREVSTISKAGELSVCELEDDLKENCGHSGINQTYCRAKGCCYSPSSMPGIPWCFVAKDKMNPACMVPRQDKLNCGFKGIQKEQCEDRGCCFANAGAEGIPWCFQKPDKSTSKPPLATPAECAVPDVEKVECGFTGITYSQCRSKGCCYRHTGSDVPFCYKTWTVIDGEEARLSEECGLLETERDDCGFDGITSMECRGKGCCYERTGHKDVPFCFKKSKREYHPGDVVVAQECAVPDTERYECGFKDIKPHECVRRGCCYALTDTSGVPYCFYKEVTEVGTPVFSKNSSASSRGGKNPEQALHMLSVLLALVGVALCCGTCVLFARTTRCTGDRRQTRCTRLHSGQEMYHAIESKFRAGWDTTLWPDCDEAVPMPEIRAIYEIENEAQQCVFEAKQLEFEDDAIKPESGAGPGNEQHRFHGARLKCDFGSQLCQHGACTVCRIVRQGSFGVDSIGGVPDGASSYAGGIRFTSWSHAAKAQGMAPGKQPPPFDLHEFVNPSAGNAVFVASVLVGRPEFVSEPTSTPLPEGLHSRCTDPTTGIDELVIFDEAQALPVALIIFKD